MQYLLMALLAAMALAMTTAARAETVQFDTQILEVEPLATTDVAAGATVAMKVVNTEDLSAQDGWCKVFISYK